MKYFISLNNLKQPVIICLLLLVSIHESVFGQSHYSARNVNELVNAIISANTDGTNSIITLTDFFYTFNSDVEDSRAMDGLALPVIEDDGVLTILGDNATFDLNIAGGARLRYFYIENGATCVLRGISMQNGLPDQGLGGGAIYNRGDLTLERCFFDSNQSGDNDGANAGAIYIAAGNVKINDCEFARNFASSLGSAFGGGIYQDGGTLKVNRCSFQQNDASGQGGAFYLNNGSAEFFNSSFHNNDADQVVNNQGTLKIVNCAIADGGMNFPSIGLVSVSGGETQIKNTIVANNMTDSGSWDVNGSLTDLGHNIIGSTMNGDGGLSSPTTLFDTNPGFLNFTNLGGFTTTYEVDSSSPAFNAGATDSDVPSVDQRGFLRDDNPDIGPFEVQGVPTLSSVFPGSPDQTSFRIEWENSGAASIDNYLVDVSVSPNFEPGSFVPGFQDAIVDRDRNFFDVTGLSEGTLYFYRVKIQLGSKISDNDPIFSVRTLTSAIPSPDLSLTGLDLFLGLFQISWAPITNVTEYRVDVATGPNFTADELYIEFIDYSTFDTFVDVDMTSAPPGTTFYVRVRAVSGDLTSISSQTFVVTPPPAPPSGLVATAISKNRIRLSWTDNSDNELAFELYRSTGNNEFEFLTEVPANVTTYEDSLLSQATTYSYQVAAFNSTGDTPFSNTASATTLDPPERPVGLQAFAISTSEIILRWTDRSDNETGFIIERASSPNQGFVAIDTVGTDINTYNDTSPTTGIVNYYRVRAYNTTEGASGYTNVRGATPADIPAAPTNLIATALSSDRASLAWIDNSNNELGFRIEVSNIAETEGFFIEIANVGPNITSFIDSNLVGNQVYTYRVVSYNDNGVSIFSNEDTVSTAVVDSIAVPTAPSDLSAEPITKDEVILKWNDNSATEDVFIIERSLFRDTLFSVIARVPEGISRYQDTGLDTVRYYYRVRSSNQGGASAYSNTAFTTPTCNLTVGVSINQNDIIARICDDKSALLLLNTNVINASYQWRRNKQDIPGANQNIYLATDDGQYTCMVRSGDCELESATPAVVILDNLFSIELDLDDNGVLSTDLVGAETYQWYFDFEPIPGAIGDIYRPTQEGTYYVEVTLSNCTATSSLYFFEITSTEDFNVSDQMDVFPSPGHDVVEFNLESTYIGGDYEINIIDTKGKKYSLDTGSLLEPKIHQNLDISHLPAGVYFVEFKSEKGSGRRKIVKY